MTLRRQLGMRSVADNAFDALKSAAEYARLRQTAADELVAARSRYWALYPDKPGFKEAEREFSRLLTRRELYYLSQTINTGQPQTQMSALNVLTGGSRGYEIPFAAQNLFFNGWVPAVRAQLGGGQVVLHSSEELRRAIEASQPQFDEYMIVRDLEEFRLAGRTPPGIAAPYWTFVSGVVEILDQEAMPLDPRLDNLPEYRGWSNDREIRPPYPIAERLYRDTERVFGAERVRAAHARVMSAQGPVPVPAELGRWRDSNRFAAMMNELGSGSPKSFLLGSLRGGGRSTAEWSYAESQYATLVEAAGSEKALLSATEKLRLAPKEAGTERQNYPLLERPADFGSDFKVVEAVLRDMLGIGENARKATELARNTELRREYDFSGEYVVTGQYMSRPLLGLVTFTPNADGTLGITTRVDNLQWERPRIIRQVGRWHAENEIRLDVDAVGTDFPPMSYLVDYKGRNLRGKWGTWEQDLGRVDVTRSAVFYERANIGGTYEMMMGPRNGTVTISRNGDGTFLFDFDELNNGVVHVKYKGTGRWLGPTLKVDFKDKYHPPRQYSVSGIQPGDMLVEPYVPERLVRNRIQPAAEVQPAAEPEPASNRRRRN
jgi:hypothetical protein